MTESNWIRAAALLACSFASAASAEVGVRAGLEAPIFTHDSRAGGSTVTCADSLQPAVDVLLSYFPIATIGLDVEFREGFAATGSGYARTGTAIGPGLTFSFPLFPVYVRGSFPVHLEPGAVAIDLRAAAGLAIKLALVSLYVEAAAELSLAAKGLGDLDTQQLSLGAGLWFKF